MAEDAADQLMIAVIDELKLNAGLDILVVRRIFDYVPRNTEYPYITVHITDSGEWDTTSDNGEEHSLYIHAWDDKEGSKRVNQIMRFAFEQLHNSQANFTLTDHNLINIRRVNKQVVREGQLYHGIGLFRAVTEET